MHMCVYTVYGKKVATVTVVSKCTKLRIRLRRSNSAGRAKISDKEMYEIGKNPFYSLLVKMQIFTKM